MPHPVAAANGPDSNKKETLKENRVPVGVIGNEDTDAKTQRLQEMTIGYEEERKGIEPEEFFDACKMEDLDRMKIYLESVNPVLLTRARDRYGKTSLLCAAESAHSWPRDHPIIAAISCRHRCCGRKLPGYPHKGRATSTAVECLHIVAKGSKEKSSR
ncbi:hypothetical protein CC78DRAFT_540010 [Lojkania enalia]|uniref:Uncharacterized protein n=1 Tax=Lojkania enalia TaxID=147567 RepID=A0A9P4TQE7_9PLEO|nr:hypothetical protein CC78DRAFT_540010 [Didymosphaeria enalia]